MSARCLFPKVLLSAHGLTDKHAVRDAGYATKSVGPQTHVARWQILCKLQSLLSKGDRGNGRKTCSNCARKRTSCEGESQKKLRIRFCYTGQKRTTSRKVKTTVSAASQRSVSDPIPSRTTTPAAQASPPQGQDVFNSNHVLGALNPPAQDNDTPSTATVQCQNLTTTQSTRHSVSSGQIQEAAFNETLFPSNPIEPSSWHLSLPETAADPVCYHSPLPSPEESNIADQTEHLNESLVSPGWKPFKSPTRISSSGHGLNCSNDDNRTPQPFSAEEAVLVKHFFNILVHWVSVTIICFRCLAD